MNKPQKLVVHVHAARKLFHVSVHNENTKTGTNWTVQAAKARWVYAQTLLGKGNAKGQERSSDPRPGEGEEGAGAGRGRGGGRRRAGLSS